MKKQFWLLFVVVMICSSGYVRAERREDPFKRVKELIQNAPVPIYDDQGKRIGGAVSNGKTVRLRDSKRKDYIELIKKVAKDYNRLRTGVEAKREHLQTRDGKKKEAYYTKRIELDEKRMIDKKEEFDWINKCFGKPLYTDIENANREDPFETLWHKLLRIPAPKSKKLKPHEIANKTKANGLIRSIYIKSRPILEDLYKAIDRSEDSVSALKKILDSKQGQKKKSYYEKQLANAMEKLEKANDELKWFQKCLGRAKNSNPFSNKAPAPTKK